MWQAALFEENSTNIPRPFIAMENNVELVKIRPFGIYDWFRKPHEGISPLHKPPGGVAPGAGPLQYL